MIKGEERMVFALGRDATGESMLILGVSQACWDYMKDGKTHHFDLAKAGLPMKLVVFGAPTRDQCVKTIEAHNARAGAATLFQPGKDFGIDSLREKDAKP